MSTLADLRRCFREPIAELYDAVRLLDASAVAHMSKQSALAAELLSLADMPVIRDWLNSIWGSKSKCVQCMAGVRLDFLGSPER